MSPEKASPHAELEERLRFETLIADLSSKFVNLPGAEVDREITDAERHICELLASLGLTTAAGLAQGANDKPASPAAKPQLPKDKQTTLGLYVTSREACEKWKADPDKIKIIDVRMPEEYLFVGHPTMAWKIPLAAQSYEWDAEKKHFPMKPLPDFVSRVSEVANTNDTLLVMCRSGGRSASAVNLLAKAGFTNVYNITDGMEGDAVEDPASVFLGQRLVNGWKNSGCPWTYKLTPDRLLLPKAH